MNSIKDGQIVIYQKSKPFCYAGIAMGALFFVTVLPLIISGGFKIAWALLIPILILLIAINNLNKRMEFNLANKTVIRKNLFTSSIIKGCDIENFQKVISVTGDDYYVLIKKSNRYGGGIRITPKYQDLFNKNSYISEFEKNTLPILNKILEN